MIYVNYGTDEDFKSIEEKGISVKGRIVLVPAKVTSLEGVWGKIESLGITEKDIESAVQWARKRK